MLDVLNAWDMVKNVEAFSWIYLSDLTVKTMSLSSNRYIREARV